MPNAAPIITATARSMTLPLIANSRNSLMMLIGRSPPGFRVFLRPPGVRSVTRSPSRALSSALAIGETHETRPCAGSTSSTPTMVTVFSPEAPFTRTVAPKNTWSVSRPVELHDFRAFQALDEEAHPPVDLAQAFLAVDVVGVLRAIAERRGPRHGLHHLGALDLDQAAQLGFEPGVAGGRNVIFSRRRQRRRDFLLELVVRSRSSLTKAFDIKGILSLASAAPTFQNCAGERTSSSGKRREKGRWRRRRKSWIS